MVLALGKPQHVMQAFSLAGKVAAVTGKRNVLRPKNSWANEKGGARGIGRQVSEGLAEAGAQVGLPCRI